MSKSIDELREQLEEFALHLKPGNTKGRHRVGTFDTVELTRLVQSLITQAEREAVDRERNSLETEAYENERKKMSDYIDKISHPTLRIVMDTGKHFEVQQIKDVQYGGDIIIVILAELTKGDKDG